LATFLSDEDDERFFERHSDISWLNSWLILPFCRERIVASLSSSDDTESADGLLGLMSTVYHWRDFLERPSLGEYFLMKSATLDEEFPLRFPEDAGRVRAEELPSGRFRGDEIGVVSWLLEL
jgi:hypothetical protein